MNPNSDSPAPPCIAEALKGEQGCCSLIDYLSIPQIVEPEGRILPLPTNSSSYLLCRIPYAVAKVSFQMTARVCGGSETNFRRSVARKLWEHNVTHHSSRYSAAFLTTRVQTSSDITRDRGNYHAERLTPFFYIFVQLQ